MPDALSSTVTTQLLDVEDHMRRFIPILDAFGKHLQQLDVARIGIASEDEQWIAATSKILGSYEGIIKKLENAITDKALHSEVHFQLSILHQILTDLHQMISDKEKSEDITKFITLIRQLTTDIQTLIEMTHLDKAA